MSADPHEAVVGVLLAAGHARRFGADKLLQPLPDATPLALAAARALRAACPVSMAVLRADQTELAGLLASAGLAIVTCPASASGMGDSLACAVRASAAAGGWVVALADMPRVQVATVAAVRAAIENGASIAAPWHAGRRGHPVGFAARWQAALAGLTGDIGARGVLQAHPEQVCLVECDDAGVLIDIDTPAELTELCRHALSVR